MTGGIDEEIGYKETSECYLLYNFNKDTFYRVRLPDLAQAWFGHNVMYFKDHLYVINGVRTSENAKT